MHRNRHLDRSGRGKEVATHSLAREFFVPPSNFDVNQSTSFFSHALSLSPYTTNNSNTNITSDYRPMPALDAYAGGDLDDRAEADAPMSFEARARAEAAMARRDQREGRGAGGVGGRRARLPGVLQGE